MDDLDSVEALFPSQVMPSSTVTVSDIASEDVDLGAPLWPVQAPFCVSIRA
jgi:hypothetical protein